MHYGMIIDLERCVGCHACTIACKAEWDVPVEFERNWVHRLGPSLINGEMAATYYPGLCNHCNEPVCVPECPADPLEVTFTDTRTGTVKKMEVAATWKDPFDGTVQIDKSRCIGCGACVEACPYGARYVNPALTNDISSDGKADKCTYCKPRVESGGIPACVQTCITGARIFGDLDDPQSEVAQYVKKGAIGLEAEGGNLGPNSRYYGKKKDISLLTQQYTPQLSDLGQARKRALLASLVRPVLNKTAEIGLLGGAGIVMLDKALEESKRD